VYGCTPFRQGGDCRTNHELNRHNGLGDPAGFRVITLDALVHMKLLSNRDKDRTHIRDLIGVGLVDQTWLAKLAPVLAERLQGILDTPDS
jgi:hypothetical protein